MTRLSAIEFAQRAGITPRAARLAFERAAAGDRWHGHHLPVVAVSGQRSGKSGVAVVLALDHCSAELNALLQPEAPSRGEVSIGESVAAHITDDQIAEQTARLRIIQPILDTPKGSRARAEATRAVAAERHDYPGGAQTFAYDTFRAWVAAFERDGLAGLLLKRRSDQGKPRVLITREWDNNINLPEDRRHAIAAELTREARSMVANDGTPQREVLRLCADRLASRCAAEGSVLPRPRLRALCALNRKWARRQELRHFRIVHMHDKDHGTYQDTAAPRIRRELHPTPMGLLIGDVHYADMLVTEKGETVRVRLIAWLDASSMYAWVTAVLLSKGEGVRQEDVVEALSHVIFDTADGGLPQELYIDNGAEFAQLPDVMLRLANLSEMEFGSTLAKPYSPTSKGEIEGFFNILEGIFKGLDG